MLSTKNTLKDKTKHNTRNKKLRGFLNEFMLYYRSTEEDVKILAKCNSK